MSLIAPLGRRKWTNCLEFKLTSAWGDNSKLLFIWKYVKVKTHLLAFQQVLGVRTDEVLRVIYLEVRANAD